jgi:hypothetical protein
MGAVALALLAALAECVQATHAHRDPSIDASWAVFLVGYFSLWAVLRRDRRSVMITLLVALGAVSVPLIPLPLLQLIVGGLVIGVASLRLLRVPRTTHPGDLLGALRQWRRRG